MNVHSLACFVKRRYQKGTQDLYVTLHELREMASRLVKHALDDVYERAQIFSEARKAAIQAIRLANEVLVIQSTNGGRKSAPADMFDPFPCQSNSPSSWMLQLCTVLQEASLSSWRRFSAISKLRRLHIWERIFSFFGAIEPPQSSESDLSSC